MNSVSLIGRLTKDPDVRYGAQSQNAVARFTVAVDRTYAKPGEEKQTDFIGIVCFGKQAELVEKYMTKGRLVGISGRIQTGSYEKDGRRVYTTDIVADRVEFLDRGDRKESSSGYQDRSAGAAPMQAAPNDFHDDDPSGIFQKLTEDDIPF